MVSVRRTKGCGSLRDSGEMDVTCHGESSLFPLVGLFGILASDGVRVTVTISAVALFDLTLVVDTLRVTALPPLNEVSC